MTEPRRVRTQDERDTDGTALRRFASGGVIPGPPRGDDRIPFVAVDPHIWVRMEPIAPPRRRWWHRLTRRNP